MLTNKEVIEFKGSNAELCEALGKSPSADSPPHYYNFTAKSLRDRAKIAVAEGKGGELYTAGRKNRSVQPVAKPVTTVYVLPAKVSALLPAIAMKCDLGNDVSVKDYIKSNAVRAFEDDEAKLPNSVLEVFKFFNMEDDDDAKTALLVYSGVPTKRDLQIDRVAGMIKALSDMSLKGVSQSTLDLIERTLKTFGSELKEILESETGDFQSDAE